MEIMARYIELNFCIQIDFFNILNFQCDDNCMRHRLVICRDHRGTHVDDQCPEELKPVSSEPCCQFKWRNVLGHVSAI